MADLITNDGSPSLNDPDAEVKEERLANVGCEQVCLSEATPSADSQAEPRRSAAQDEQSSDAICVDLKASSAKECLLTSDQGSAKKFEPVAPETDCVKKLDCSKREVYRTVDFLDPADDMPHTDENSTPYVRIEEKDESLQSQQSDGKMNGVHDQSGSFCPPEQRLGGLSNVKEMEAGSDYDGVCQDVARPSSSIETRSACEPQQESKVVSEPQPRAETVMTFQYSFAEELPCSSSCSRPADLPSVPELKPEVIPPSLPRVILVSSSPDEDVAVRHRSSKGRWRASDKGHVFVAHGSDIRNPVNSSVAAGGKSLLNRRAVNTRTWEALKQFCVIGNLAATSDLDRQSRKDVDFLYSALTLAADAGVKGAENILGGERADRLDDFIARWTRKSHSVYCRLVQTPVCKSLSEKVTCFWRQTSVGRFFTFVSGWQADKAHSLYRKVARIYQDGGFKETISSVTGKTEANLLLLCHVVCLFLSGRTRASRGYEEVAGHAAPTGAKTTLLSKLPAKHRPAESKELGGSVKEHKKKLTGRDDTEASRKICSRDTQGKDLAASLRARPAPSGKGTDSDDSEGRSGSDENGLRSENEWAASSYTESDGREGLSRDSSFEGGPTSSRTLSCEDLDSSIDTDDSSPELSRARRKLTPVRRMTAFLKRHGYQFKTRLVSLSPAPTVIPYENLSLGQRLVCLLRKVPALAELLRDPRDPPPVMFLFGSCSCVDSEKIRRMLQMAPQAANRPRLKRKLDKVYPPETDTYPELSNPDDESEDGLDDEEFGTRDGTCQNRDPEDEADVGQENQTNGKF